MYWKIKDKKIESINEKAYFILLNDLLKSDHIGFDTETSGLNEFSDILLVGLGNNDIQLVTLGLNIKTIDLLIENNIEIIGANLKFDMSLIYWQTDKLFNNYWDVMIADQKIYQGYGRCEMNPNPISFSLESIVKRHLKKEREFIKDIRLEFINKSIKTFNPTEEQILYLCEDVKDLIAVKEKQKVLIDKYQLNHVFYKIEKPLTRVLVKMEKEGFYLDVVKWKEILKENIELRYNILTKIDKWITDYAVANGKTKYFNMTLLTASRMKEVEIKTTDLFGQPIDPKLAFKIPKSRKINLEANRINYDSEKQIIETFGFLGLELPTKDNRVAIPYVDLKKKEVLKDRGIDIKTKELFYHEGFLTGIPVLKEYTLANPDYKAKELIELLTEYSKVSTEVTNYGQNYINKINEKTGKIHTYYRQCDAVTGRLQSGGKQERRDKFNSQNVKRDNKYRNCFSAGENYSIFTCDLSGAEVVILADKANDSNLIKMAIVDDDVHSPVAQAAWRNIFHYRAGLHTYWHDYNEFKENRYLINSINHFSFDTARLHLFQQSKNFIISKQENKKLRDGFKMITFGTVYGMYAKKCAKQLNISIDEGQLVIDTVRELMPDVFKYIDTNIEFVLGKRSYKTKQWWKKPNGYLILNPYSKSRLWFPEAIKMILSNGVYEPDFFLISKMDGNCRNAPIQGTQADMIKEAMVECNKAFEQQNIDAALIIQVHDELVGKCPKNYDGTSKEYKKAPKHIKFIVDKTQEVKYLSVPEFVKETMTQVANRYLTNIKMGASCEVHDYWVK